MIKNKKFQILLLAIVLCISCFLTCFTPTIQNVYASSIDVIGGYTSVLDDLKKDASFDANKYPVIADDYSLQVMHIAESNEKELFVYVYQPSADYKGIVASSLFLSTNARGLDYKNYYLTLVSKQGVFYKYRVENFFVSSATTRDYEITSIYRKFDETIDEKLDDDNENTINEVQYAVAKHWSFTTTESGVEIGCHDIETIKITDKYVGFCRYEDGYSGFPGMGFSFHEPGYDSHFVAFTTDRQIDDLLEADVFYTKQEYSYFTSSIGGVEETYGEIVDSYAYLKGEKVGVDIPHGGSGTHFEWETIQTPEEFFAMENREVIYEFGVFNIKKETKLTDEGKKDIEGMDWILRFAMTEYSDYYSNIPNGTIITRNHHIDYTIVGNVSIMRLRFITNGVEYNLGVIDNKQQGDGNPDNYTKTTFEWTKEFKLIMAILLLILLVVVFFPILPSVLGFIFKVVQVFVKILLWLLSLPFNLIKAIFKKRE